MKKIAMKPHITRLASLLTALVLLLAMSVTAYAHDAPDTSRTGSVTVTMTYEGTVIPGGTLTLYQVGGISENDGNYSFVLTEAFADSGLSLDNISSASLASDLSDYISENSGISAAATVTIGDDGTATASDLALGLYLVVQTEAAEGFDAVSPFLVSVPMNEDGTYIYDVDATPKVGPLTKTPDTPESDTPDTPESDTPESETSEPDTPSGPTLPQTGQLNWPVPVLAILGMLLFLAGFSLRRNEGRG